MAETSAPQYTAEELHRIRVRTLWVLSGGQVLGGLAFGATIALGAVLAAAVTGSDAFSGWAVAAVTFGTAVLAIPMARLARTSGRRIALSSGMVVALIGVFLVVLSVYLTNFPVMIAGFLLIGGVQAANFQSRFAATDLATNSSRGRDLSVVVWATTVGAVAGPNLVGPGEALGDALGMPPLTGAFVIILVAQVVATALYLIGLRPDPLRVAQRMFATRSGSKNRIAGPDQPVTARFAIFAVAATHSVMVAMMAMTPVHFVSLGVPLTTVGLTVGLHILGMFALSPVFGIVADRIGRTRTMLGGQALIVVSLVVAAVGAASTVTVTVALVLLGVGWGAAMVSGSALLTEASAETVRTARQGRIDFAMNFAGAISAIIAGWVLAAIGLTGLSLVCFLPLIAVMALSPYGFRGERRHAAALRAN